MFGEFGNLGLISAPNKGAGFVETVAFNIYASRQSRIEALINELAAAEDPNDETTQNIAFAHAGFLSADDLLLCEKEYIEKEIARRWMG